MLPHFCSFICCFKYQHKQFERRRRRERRRGGRREKRREKEKIVFYEQKQKLVVIIIHIVGEVVLKSTGVKRETIPEHIVDG